MSGELRSVFEAQQRAFSAERYPAKAARQDRLARVEALIGRHEHDIVSAIGEDFGVRPAQETRLTELFVVFAAIRHARRHLGRWMRPRRVRTPLYLKPGASRIERQPLGVVGVVSPWNYPVQLALAPAVAALAAGNRVMIKPSELTPRTSALMERLVGQHFDGDELAVVTGGADVGAAFSQLPFDHLLFTGSTAVGRSVALAAAQNLTPVTLELGGKSPALILDDADLGLLAPRLAVGKLLNAGQTCIAPDYVMVPERLAGALVDALARAVAKLYPAPQRNPDYAAIVNDRHHDRLIALIDDARRKGAKVIELGGGAAPLAAGERRLTPTLILDPHDDMAVMQQEIFGPILPLETYATLDQAIARINARPRPLAMYLFGGDGATRRRVLADTVAGGVTIDDTLWHFCNEHLPFGGVGASGYGAYHGERGFAAFSHEKPIFTQSRASLAPLLYPPYGRRFESMLKLLRRIA